MLRPACWLPPKRPVTPRLDRRDLSQRPGSATRRSGAYRGGTCTRWTRTACRRRLIRLRHSRRTSLRIIAVRQSSSDGFLQSAAALPPGVGPLPKPDVERGRPRIGETSLDHFVTPYGPPKLSRTYRSHHRIPG